MKQVKDGIYKIEIPFYDIYTSSFILTNGNEAIVLDSGDSEKDAEEYVIPAIEALGVTPKYLVSSHTHQDHHGVFSVHRQSA